MGHIIGRSIRFPSHVVDPQVGLDDVRDVLLDGGLITEVGIGLEPPADAEVIDASGKYLVPGLVDMDELGISATRRVKGLGARQREQLIEVLSK